MKIALLGLVVALVVAAIVIVARSNDTDDYDKKLLVTIDMRQREHEEKSVDFALDVKSMWETVKSPADGQYRSTDRAVKAARRVFNSVSLVGKSRRAILSEICAPKSLTADTQGSAERGKVSLRFDDGYNGFTATLLFDANDLCISGEVSPHP